MFGVSARSRFAFAARQDRSPALFCVLYRMGRPSDSRAGVKKFLNQDREAVTTRRKRELQSQRRAAIRAARLAPAVNRRREPGNRHRLYPCCGHRRERCVCDWTLIEARLNPAAWAAFVERVDKAELKYVGALVVTQWFLAFHVYFWRRRRPVPDIWLPVPTLCSAFPLLTGRGISE